MKKVDSQVSESANVNKKQSKKMQKKNQAEDIDSRVWYLLSIDW